MIRAYNELYLSDARRTLASSFDHAVYTLGYELPKYYRFFMNTDTAHRFENGDPFIISGMSGVELSYMIDEKKNGIRSNAEPVYHDDRSREYWTGWALSYYQWYSNVSFRRIDEEVSIESVLLMYDKYHEMDISQFVDHMNELRSKARACSYLKMIRESRGLSQSELANLSGVPLRTLQQYEQKQKNINRARADYVISLSKVLGVSPQLLIEIE